MTPYGLTKECGVSAAADPGFFLTPLAALICSDAVVFGVLGLPIGHSTRMPASGAATGGEGTREPAWTSRFIVTAMPRIWDSSRSVGWSA